jgi:hypothetical protein
MPAGWPSDDARERTPVGKDVETRVHSERTQPIRGALLTMSAPFVGVAKRRRAVKTTPALLEKRALCGPCSAHTLAVIGRATIGGDCANCGSYDLERLSA